MDWDWDYAGLIGMNEWVGLYRNYLSTIESFLETEIEKCSKRSRELSREQHKMFVEKMGRPPLDFEMERSVEKQLTDMRWEELHRFFVPELYSSLFISLCVFLETRLRAECRYLKQKGRINPPDETCKKCRDGIGRFKDCLKEGETGLDFSRNWGDIVDYFRLRNCIVHAGGSLEGLNPKHRDPLKRKYDIDTHFSPSREFGEQVLDTFEKFLG